MYCKRGKRGQVTIFIIIAIIIVALGILMYMFYPKIKENLGLVSLNPQSFIQECIEKDAENSIGILSLQGGSLNPENYFLYNNNKIEYLCYNNEFYKQCVMQQPMLKEHIEEEIKKSIREKTDECFDKLKESYEGRGYSVEMKKGDFNVELLPKRIILNFDYDLTLTKESSERYKNFKVALNNNLYELVIIATSILNWEARYGDSETTVYMNYYPELKVEKKKQTDGTAIYILTDRDTGNKFQFASRSVAWPPGYGITQGV